MTNTVYLNKGKGLHISLYTHINYYIYGPLLYAEVHIHVIPLHFPFIYRQSYQ